MKKSVVKKEIKEKAVSAKKEKKEKEIVAPVVETTSVEVVKPTVKPAFKVSPLLRNILIAGVVVAAIATAVVYKYGIVATVNNKPISRLEYFQAMENQVGKQTLENMITEVLIFEAAQKNSLTIDQGQIDSKMTELDTQFQAQGATLDQMLAQENMTRSELERQIRLQQIVETLGQGDTAVSDEEVATYMTENKDQLPTGKKPEELKTMVKDQLIAQAKSANIQEWISNLRSTAVINYH